MNNAMPFQFLNVRLVPMEKAHLDLVREKRNLPEMRQWMTTDHEITPEEMQEWFETLASNRHYWMVEFEGRLVGQVNLKGGADGSADPGWMFWDEPFQRGCGSGKASLALIVLAFEKLGYTSLRGITAADHRRALRYSKILGFKDVGERVIDSRPYRLMEMTMKDYRIAKKRLLELLT